MRGGDDAEGRGDIAFQIESKKKKTPTPHKKKNQTER